MPQSIKVLYVPTNLKSVLRFKLTTFKQTVIRWFTNVADYEPSNSVEVYNSHGVYMTARKSLVSGRFTPAVFVHFSDGVSSAEALVSGRSYMLVNGKVYFVNLDVEIDPVDKPVSAHGKLSSDASLEDMDIPVNYYVGMYYGIMYVVDRQGTYTFFTQGTQSATTR